MTIILLRFDLSNYLSRFVNNYRNKSKGLDTNLIQIFGTFFTLEIRVNDITAADGCQEAEETRGVENGCDCAHQRNQRPDAEGHGELSNEHHGSHDPAIGAKTSFELNDWILDLHSFVVILGFLGFERSFAVVLSDQQEGYGENCCVNDPSIH